MNGPTRLLVFEQRMLGDAVMSLPFIRAAAARYEVHVVCAPGVARIFRLALPAERILAWQPPWLEPGTLQTRPSWFRAGWKTLIRNLRDVRADVAVSVWADTRVHGLMALARVPRRVGFSMSGTNYYAPHLPWRRRQLLIGRILDRAGRTIMREPILTTALNRDREDQHHVDNWRQIAAALDLAWDASAPWFTPPAIPLPADLAERIAAARAAGRPIWLVHPGARVPAQRWSLLQFGAVAREELAARGALCILVNAPEKTWPSSWRGEFPLFQPDSLEQLMALTGAADGVLCNDTSVSHIAAALGKSVVAVFLASKPQWFGPYGDRCRSVASTTCPLAPCMGRCLQERWICHDADLRPGIRTALHELLG